MRVEEIMDVQAVPIHENTTLDEIGLLVVRNRTSDFPVVNTDYEFRGMVYEQNLLKALYRDGNIEKLEGIRDFMDLDPAVKKITAGQIMTCSVKTLSAEESIVRAGATLLLEKQHLAAVLRGTRLAGIVTQSRIFEELMKGFEKCSASEKSVKEGEQKGKNEEGPEMRFFERTPLELPFAYKLIKDPNGKVIASDGKIGKTMDASAGGLMVLIQEGLPADAVLDIAMDLYQNDQPVRMVCRVVRCVPSKTPGFFQAGIMYVSVAPEERRRINRYLADLIQKKKAQPDS